jgi:uncharacterized repeat protein (TIGR01451 family)
MKSIYIQLLFIITISVSKSFGQTQWTLRKPTPLPGMSFNFMHPSDSNKVFGIATWNIGMKSTNGGQTWQKAPIYDSLSFVSSMDFPGRDIGYSTFMKYEAGTSEEFYLAKSTNGGESWQSKKLNHTIIMISFPNDTMGYGLGVDSIKRFFKTIDGGLNWMEMPFTVTGKNKQQILAVSESVLIYLADDKLFRSIDGGQSWSQRPTGISRSNAGNDWGTNPIYKNPGSGILYYFGINNKIARSLDTGKTWTVSVIPNPQELIIHQVHFFDSLSGYALTENGFLDQNRNMLFKTTDGGATWVPFASNLDQFETNYKIAFANRNVGYAFGSNWNVLKTSDGGSHWKNLISGFKGSFSQSCFQRENSVWALGDSGYVWHSHDRGKNWDYQKIMPEFGPETGSLTDIVFPTPVVGYLTGPNLWKSTNGGLSWIVQPVSVPGLGSLNNFGFPTFLNKDTGFIYGPEERLLKTTNGGVTWKVAFVLPQVPAPGNYSYLQDIKFYDKMRGYLFCYTYSTIKTYSMYKTSDGGETWMLVPSPISGSHPQGEVSVVDSLHIFSNYGGYWDDGEVAKKGLYVTINGGQTWRLIKSYVALRADVMKFVSPSTGYAIVIQEGLYKTLDTGRTWSLISHDLDKFISNDLLFYQDKPVMAFGTGIYSSNEWTGKDPYIAMGTIVKKEDQDCIQDPNEVGLANRFVTAEPGPYFASTDLNGQYQLSILDTGLYQVSQIPYSPTLSILESQHCPPANVSIPVNITNWSDTSRQNDFINFVKPCPILAIRQVHSPLRPCRNGFLHLEIRNVGNVVSDTEHVVIKFPKHLYLISANEPYNYNSIDSTYSFTVYPLNTTSFRQIVIMDSLACFTSITGQTLCVKSTIPNVPACLLQSPNWDGADLEVASRCQNGQTRFTLHNKGAAMATTSQYQIFIDSALVYQAPFQLAANGAMTVSIPASAPSGFVRLVVPQSANHPLSTFASAEANCATGQSTNGLFPPPDESPLVDIECVTVTNAYDPNDKTVFPTGWGTDGNIEPGTEFKYTVRFQNTGSDTAFKVVLVDTLDEDLDIASLQIGISSHNFSFKVSGKGRPVLTWTFDNILLPDSGRNQEASNGFVNFSIRPKTGLALGTRLENFADIYFDFNDPVRTNTTVNTIWQPTYTPGILDTVFVTATKTPIVGKDLSIFPNPTKGKVNVVTAATASICVFNSNGAMVLRRNLETGSNEVDLSSLSRGLYLIQLNGSGGKQQTKIVLE